MKKRDQQSNDSTAKSRRSLLLAIAIFTLTSVLGFWLVRPPNKAPSFKELTEKRQAPMDLRSKKLAAVIKAEDTVLDLSPKLQLIADWFCNTSLGANAASLPEELQTLTSAQPLAPAELSDVLVSSSSEELPFLQAGSWPITSDQKSNQAGDNPWKAAAGVLGVVSSGKFGVLSAKYSDENPNLFILKTSFSARARRDNERLGIDSHQTLTWQKQQDKWTLKHWEQEDFNLTAVPQQLFEDVLEEALPDANERDLAERSYHDERLVTLIRSGTVDTPDPRFTPFYPIESSYCFPSVSVVDYDQDGFDDLFLTARWGPTQLLHNQGDGTFRETGSEVGLQEKFVVNCAAFADFDNDGDKDVVLGFSLLPAKFYRNDNGQFVDVTPEDSPLASIAMVSGIAVSDINRDGLLDIYLSTYRPEENQKGLWIKKFVTKEELPHLQKRLPESHRWLNNIGPANALLINQGDNRFTRAPFEGDWSQWRDSYQATWADFDDDGDDDLYVCNDFSPDSLLRNDTPVGAMEPQFVDVTKEVFGKSPQAFGMGADWGDFDRDGDLDLYVSNMYSKAGKRIIDSLGGDVDPRIPASAAGNFLYESRDGQLVQVAGYGKDQFHVHKVGWSYGGQFADFDNSGTLDLYVPSGYYTPPPEIATKVDL